MSYIQDATQAPLSAPSVSLILKTYLTALAVPFFKRSNAL
jgi:hypothetical protein